MDAASSQGDDPFFVEEDLSDGSFGGMGDEGDIGLEVGAVEGRDSPLVVCNPQKLLEFVESDDAGG